MKRSLRLTALLMAAVMCFVPVLQVQAAAISGTAVMIGLGAAAVVSSVMIGLGVMPGSDRNAFNTIVQSCTESSSVGAYIRDGLIDVLRYKNSGGGIRYGVLQNLIEAVRGWLFDDCVVEVSNSIPMSTHHTFTLYGETYTSVSSSPFFLGCYYSDDGYAYLIALASIYNFSDIKTTRSDGTVITSSMGVNVTSSSGQALKYSSMFAIHYTGNDLSTCSLPFLGTFNWKVPMSERIESAYTAVPFSENDVSLGDIAIPSDDLTSSYADWSAGSIAVPHPGIDIPGVDTPGTGEDTGEEADKPPLFYWPTGIIDPSTDTTDVLTQENIIAGTGTLDDTLTGEITGPIVGGITGDITLEDTPAIPGEGEDVGTGEGTGEGEIVAPADKATFMLDLREIFPFCIPFDIYKFLNILSADPVAPVFEWKIPVPQIGKEFGFEVDLSAWDNVAAVFRKLELLAFIVGLAVLTRDKFIRS